MNHQEKNKNSPQPTCEMPAIAVIGMSTLFPGSPQTGGFWHDICVGRDQIRDVPPEHWLIDDYYDPDPTAPDKTYGKRGAFLDSVAFDSLAHGIPPHTVQQTDTSQLLGLIVAQQVLDDAATGSFAHVDKSRISVILGATGTTELVVHLGSRLQRPIWLKALRANGIAEDEAQAICDQIANTYVPWTEASFPGLLGNVIAGRIANRFDLGGTNCVVDAACASSLSALAMGLNELYMDQSDMVITGGVDTLNDILMYMCFSKTPALSPSGDCRPFSDQADGTILGEGVGLLALRRLADAERDGDSIYAVIRGLGASSDGTGTAIYAPKSSGQAQALRRAYASAGYAPRTVELLEAHGTATTAGDLAEFQGASSVFAETEPDDTQWCAIGSVKSQIGHTKGAAGAASLIKAVLALHHKVLPPTIKVEYPNPNLSIESSPFYINTAARPWVRDDAHPRRASVSSFGFGGSNFHITLEEYTGNGQQKARFRSSPTELFVVGAESADRLIETSSTLTAGFEFATDVGLSDVQDGFQFLARETQRNFQNGSFARLAIVAKDFGDLQKKLSAAIAAIRQMPNGAQHSPQGWYYSGAGGTSRQGQVAFLFPGQGSQYVGMGSDLALAFRDVQILWDEAANLPFEGGKKLHEVVFPIPAFDEEERAAQADILRATQWAQPAIGVTSLGYLAILAKLGITPDCVGGHSFGEITALHAAGALDRETFFAVARQRGELMAEAAKSLPAAMMAVFHDAGRITDLLTQWNADVVVANHNSPQQVVLSGSTTAIETAEEHLEQQGIRFQRLPVSTAFHSSIVDPATTPFKAFLDHVTITQPQLPVYANSTADIYPATPATICETMANQIALPVRFAEQIAAMFEAGVDTFIEVGPGTVLSKLVTSCLDDRPHHAVALDHKDQHGLTSLWHGIAQLIVAGVPMQLANLWDGIECGEDPRQRKAPKLALNISGVNYNKPYPPEGGTAALPAPNHVRKTVPSLSTTSNGYNEIHDHLDSDVSVNGASISPATLDRTMKIPDNSMPVASLEAAPAAAPTLPLNGTPTHNTTTNGTAIDALPRSQALPDRHINLPPHPVQSAPASAPEEALQWVGAFQELQRQTVDAHMAFLRVAEQSMKSLEAMLTTQPATAPASVTPETTPATSPETEAINPGSTLFQPMEPDGTVDEMRTQQVTLPTPTIQPIVQAAVQPSPALPAANGVAQPAQSTTLQGDKGDLATSPTPAHDLHAIMLDVVSEKTGYPTEMLEPSMSLSADLGIDSIKRVEILAAMRERVPDLPEFDPQEMAALNTLDEIVTYMDDTLGATTPQEAAIPAVAQSPNGSTVPSTPAHDLHAIMLDVVSEKTGYPTEMLEPGMSLSADLGIDSIKRVEILAAMRERVPDLPEFDPQEMASLNTLNEIVTYMDYTLGATTPQEAAIPAVAQSPNGSTAPSTPAHDLHAIMLDVVSEKTGYPTEMLEPGMSLSADLGIDSIKRVEILAAMRERVPDLPEFDAQEMAALNTLDEIVTYMDDTLAAPVVGTGAVNGTDSTATVNGAAPQQVSRDAKQLGRYVLEAAPQPAPGFAPPFLIDGTHVQITDDGRGVAVALADSLKRNGVNATVCKTPSAEDRAVICLAGLREADGAQEAAQLSAEGFAIATAVAPTFEVEGGLFVTVQDTGGDHCLSPGSGARAWLGGFAGLAKSAAKEWPKAVVRSIDIGQTAIDRNASQVLSVQEIADRLAAELLTGGAEPEIGLPADGRRLGFLSVAQELDSIGEQPAIHNQSVIVVSGGARGVTAAAIIELAQQTKAKVALLGRTVLEDEPGYLHDCADDAALKQALLAHAQSNGKQPTPKELSAAASKILAAREIRTTLSALSAAGSDARYLSCDVTDTVSTAAALQSVRDAWGPITGIVHGAGVLADKRLAQKSAADFQHVYNTKVLGLHALLAATQTDPLTLICLFSSVAARAGNAGQADYAMANEVLNRVAQAEAQRRNQQSDNRCLVKSIGWGPWEGGMVTPLLKAKFAEMGVQLIPLAAGAHSFVTEIRHGSSADVDVVIGGGTSHGGALLGGTREGDRFPVVYDVTVCAESHPYLESHRINGTVVLPLVIVKEWFMLAASTMHGLPFHGKCLNLRVLKGVPLPAYASETTRFRVQLQPDPEQPRTMQAMLYDQDGVSRFAAQLISADSSPLSNGQEAPPTSSEWPTLTWSGTDLYGTKLFHGPDFAALHSVTRMSDTGAEAMLVGSRTLNWTDAGHETALWATDPGLIDGGLQLARVWGIEQLQQLTLPTALAEFVLHQPGLFNAENRPDQQVRCLLQGQVISTLGTRCDLWFIDDASGTLLAEIRGLEMYGSSETPAGAGAN